MRNYLSSFLLMLTLYPLFSWSDPVIIANPKNDVRNLSESQAANLFLLKTNAFLNGEKAIPINLPEGNAMRDLFYNKIVGKNPQQLKAYWSRLIFSGRKTPPLEFQTPDKIKRFVSENIEAIGYVDSAEVDSSVKVIAIVDK